jgi:hypothetical protein
VRWRLESCAVLEAIERCGSESSDRRRRREDWREERADRSVERA